MITIGRACGRSLQFESSVPKRVTSWSRQRQIPFRRLISAGGTLRPPAAASTRDFVMLCRCAGLYVTCNAAIGAIACVVPGV